MSSIIYKVLIINMILNSYLGAMELIGKIKLKGSMPHTYLVIEDVNTNKSYSITNANDFNLAKMQNITLTLEVKLLKKALGPGFPTVVEVIKVK